MVPPNTHSLMKRRAAPLQPPKIIYFFRKFRPKRARNYAYLAFKIQNLLRQGGTAPLQPSLGGQPTGPPVNDLHKARSAPFARSFLSPPMLKIFLNL